jgi:hypothetical protein
MQSISIDNHYPFSNNKQSELGDLVGDRVECRPAPGPAHAQVRRPRFLLLLYPAHTTTWAGARSTPAARWMGREERGGGTPRRRRRPRAAAVDLAEEAVRGGRGRNGGARCEPRVFLFGVDFLFGDYYFSRFGVINL